MGYPSRVTSKATKYARGIHLRVDPTFVPAMTTYEEMISSGLKLSKQEKDKVIATVAAKSMETALRSESGVIDANSVHESLLFSKIPPSTPLCYNAAINIIEGKVEFGPQVQVHVSGILSKSRRAKK